MQELGLTTNATNEQQHSSQRTELCAVDAHWIVGAAPTCDIHAKVMCDAVDWGWDELWQEAGRSPGSVAVPWEDRKRLKHPPWPQWVRRRTG